nr:MAG TPA: hypothetical protein [Caudoviricetes sp.]
MALRVMGTILKGVSESLSDMLVLVTRVLTE